MQEAVFHFPIDGRPADCREMRGGHINRSWLVTTDRGARYVLQRVNRVVFPNMPAVMRNAAKIGAWMERRPAALPAAIRYLPALDGAAWYEDGRGGAWRCYRYVEGLCLSKPESPADLYQSAVAFGRFLQVMDGFPAAELEETIPHFHDTPDRFRQLREASESDSCGRRAAVERELQLAFACEEKASRLHALRLSGALPLRVTHNDTKLTNVLLDKETRRALCVIDLDTVMPGLAAYDFGDAVRAGAAVSCGEKAELDGELFAAFTRGFLEACPCLSEEEIDSLSLGAYTITVECGVRFLSDYLSGDVYFAIDGPERNLSRARRQLSLAEDIGKRAEELRSIVQVEKQKLKLT